MVICRKQIINKMKAKKIIGLVVFLGFPFILQFLALNLIQGEIGFWVLLVLIISWIYLFEKKTLASIGWQKLTLITVITGLGLGVILFIVFGVIMTAVQAIGLPLNQDIAQLISNQPMLLLILIALRAGVVEEVLYRGYAYERLFDLTKSKWLAALIPIIIFTLVHLPWGVGHLVFVFLVSGIFMLLYMAKRNLPLLIIAHFTTDVLALIALPYLLGTV